MFKEPLKNYCACACWRPAVLKMLMYPYTFRFLRSGGHHQPPARYVFPRLLEVKNV